MLNFRWRIQYVTLLLVALLGFPVVSSALTVEAVDFDQLVARAEVIVIGTVRDTRSALGADGQTIYTWADLVDLDVLKGDVPEAVYRLRVPGGVLGDAAQIYPGMPVLKRGERYVLFVRGHLQQFIPFVGAFQGVYSIRRVDGEERVLRYDRLSSETAFAAGAMLNSAPTLDEFVQQIRGQLINKPTMSDAP